MHDEASPAHWGPGVGLSWPSPNSEANRKRQEILFGVVSARTFLRGRSMRHLRRHVGKVQESAGHWRASDAV